MGRASDPKERKEEERYDASRRAAARMMTKLGLKLEQLDRWIEDPPDGETFITELRFKMGGGWDGGILAIVKTDGGEGKRIGFHVGDTLADALVGMVNRLENGSIKWKEDTGYGGNETK